MPETHGCSLLQEVSSLTGNVIDEFTLTKPAGWKPNYPGMCCSACSRTSCLSALVQGSLLYCRAPAAVAFICWPDLRVCP